MNIDKNKKKYIGIIIVICIALLSVFVLGKKLTNVETYSSTISSLDEKKTDVLGLTAAISTASILITAFPDDIGTPIATQLASLSSYLLIILTVIFLEKYSLVIIGIGVFYIAIPIACLLYIIYLLNDNLSLRKIALKLLAFSIVITLVVPTSTWISNKIDKTYQENLVIDNTPIEVIETPTEDNKQEEQQVEQKWYEKISNAFSNYVETQKNKIETSTQDIANSIKDKLNNFIEATAVMIVTSCVIPLISILIFIWLAKMILEVDTKKTDLLEIKNKIQGSLFKENTLKNDESDKGSGDK